MSSAEHLAAVRRYYDKNTPGFLRFGEGADMGAIHRAVWAPSVGSHAQAFRFVDDLILERLSRHGVADPYVLDLGCGVGASLAYLAAFRPCHGVGITLSPVQVRMGNDRLKAQGLSERVRLVEASYLELPDLPPADLALAIESFSLGPDPAGFFRSAADALAPGGMLVMCDDFLGPAVGQHPTPKTSRLLERFRKGWHAGSLVPPDHADALAQEAGLRLVEDRDLTPYIRLGRPRDRLIALAVRFGGWLPVHHPWWYNLLGGDALQTCLATGRVQYLFRVWTKD